MKAYKQRDATDCGAACLAFVCAHYGLRLPLPLIRQVAGTSPAGTTAMGLIQAAVKLGLSAKGVKGGADALPSVPLPAIAHCLVDQKRRHYVVLVAWGKRHARVMDPVLGVVEKWSHARFASVWTGVLVLLAPTESFQPGDRTRSPVARLWTLLQRQRAIWAQALVGAIVMTLLGLSMSFYVQKIVDQVIPDGNRRLLNLLGSAMLVVLVAQLWLRWLQSMLVLRTAQRIDAHIILGYYRHLLQLPQAFFDTMRVGEITSRVRDAIKVRVFLNTTLLNLVLNPLILIFSLGALFLQSWKLALFTVGLLPLFAGVYLITDLRNKRYQRQIMERTADFDAQLVESLGAQRTVRAHGLEAQMGLRLEVRLVRLLKTQWSSAFAGVATGTAAMLVTQLFVIGLLWVGAGLVLDASLTPGQLVSCYTLAGFLVNPIVALVALNSSIRDALIATDRLYEIMDLEREEDAGTMLLETPATEALRFEHVSFGHPGRLPTLRDLDHVFARGQLTSVVGESGCGKSTLLALIQRHYLPDKGRVTLGGADITYYQLASYRAGFSVVPQKVDLISGTVLENIAPEESVPDFPRLLQSCRDAGILDFIEQLPLKFQTYLNENGNNLSGGQRQRLAVARALYRDAPVFLLDEPSSALDARAEEQLAETLRRLSDGGKTVIVVSHAARLLAVSDQVVRLSEGRVVTVESSRSRGGAAGPAGAVKPGEAVALPKPRTRR